MARCPSSPGRSRLPLSTPFPGPKSKSQTTTYSTPSLWPHPCCLRHRGRGPHPGRADFLPLPPAKAFPRASRTPILQPPSAPCTTRSIWVSRPRLPPAATARRIQPARRRSRGEDRPRCRLRGLRIETPARTAPVALCSRARSRTTILRARTPPSTTRRCRRTRPAWARSIVEFDTLIRPTPITGFGPPCEDPADPRSFSQRMVRSTALLAPVTSPA